MNKTAIKNFAIWARNKLIADIKYKAGLLGITDKAINDPLTQSTQTVQFFDIGTTQPYAITEDQIKQRKKLVEVIQVKAKQTDYKTAYENVVEEVAYTWFNRLIAIRFMEVNDYLPSRIRVLSSVSDKKAEPDLVTHPMEADLDYSAYEKDRIMQLKHENKLDELFRMLFIKQCNALNANLPELFEKTNDYTELLLNISFTDRDGVVYHLMNDIPEDDFNVTKEGQVEIIGWLYQFYNTEPKNKVFARPKKQKIKKEEIPAATQLFTPDWIVRYMVENSLGRLWVEGHPNEDLKLNWKYYLEEPEQEEAVQKQLEKIREDYQKIKPETIKVMDPCMGSGHILVYAFDVLMQIYESVGYSPRDAAKSIVENNLYGLDIDDRAYQLAYFAVMMKARQYNRRILNGETACHLFAIKESNTIDRNHLKLLGEGLSEVDKQNALRDLKILLDQFEDAKEYGSLIHIAPFNWELLRTFVSNSSESGQLTMESIGKEETQIKLLKLIDIGMLLAQKYDVVVTNPPYMGNGSIKMSNYLKIFYPNEKYDTYSAIIKRGFNLLKSNGYEAMVTGESWLFLKSFERMRKEIVEKFSLNTLSHFGTGAFEAGFGTVAFVFRKNNVNTSSICINLTQISSNEKENSLLRKVKTKDFFYCILKKLKKIPGVPFAYWIHEELIKTFEKSNLADTMVTKAGIVTGNNDLFMKNWYEVNFFKIKFNSIQFDDIYQTKWVPTNKGGGYRKWFGNIENIVNIRDIWDDSKVNKSVRRGDKNYYFKEGITWSTLSNVLGARKSDIGFVCDTKGSMAFPFNSNDIYRILGIINSSFATEVMNVLSPTLDFNKGYIEQIPYVHIDEEEFIDLVKDNIKISRNDWNNYENSWAFLKSPLIEGNSIENAYEKYKQINNSNFNRLVKNEEKINEIIVDNYELENKIKTKNELKLVSMTYIVDKLSRVPENLKQNKFVIDKGNIVNNFISYAVGCMLGRYSLDVEGLAYAGGDWNAENYKTFIPDKDNIIPITDEEYFKDDIVGLFFSFVKKVYGEETLEENLDFIADALGKKGNSSREIIRNYFLKDFFKDHCKTYQKRPIYWLFDSGKANGFKALIYMHRYDENTIGNLRIDYLHKLQQIYESEIARMQDTIENSSQTREVAAATMRKEKLIKQLQETKQYDEKIAHLALARIAIDLDDGVKVNYEKVQQDINGKKLNVLAKI